MNDDRQYSVSNGNVFADLGFANPEEETVKAGLVRQISRIIQDRKWTQSMAAEAMSIDQPKVSALLRGRFGGFSTDRLMRLLNALDQDVHIIITPKPAEQCHGQISIYDTYTSAVAVKAVGGTDGLTQGSPTNK